MHFRQQVPSIWQRLALILLLLALAGGLRLGTSTGGGAPTSDWYALSRQKLLQADLFFRAVLYLRQLRLPPQLSWLGDLRLWEEQAIANYEREALAQRPNPAALYRLGIIYGSRGYFAQARAVLGQAAMLDEENAELYFALATIYQPGQRLERTRMHVLARMQRRDPWLAALVWPTYYERLGDWHAAEAARQQARELAQAFGWRLAALAGAFGSLGALGLGILLVGIIRWAFFVRLAGRPVRPSLVVPWGPLPALEIVALLYFATTTLGLLAVSLITRLAPLLSESGRVLVLAAQYLLGTGGVFVAVYQRVGGSRHWLSLLGWRWRRPLRLLAEGIGGYAVLLVLFVLLVALLPGGNPLAFLAQAGETLIVAGQTWPIRLIVFVLICLLAPVGEEIIFRGYVYPGLRRALSVSAAVFLSGLLFALLHNNLTAMLPITLIGIVLAVLYERNLSIVPCIVCHALNNTFVFFLLVLSA